MPNQATPGFRCLSGTQRIIVQLIDVVATWYLWEDDLSRMLQGVSVREFLAFVADSEHGRAHGL